MSLRLSLPFALAVVATLACDRDEKKRDGQPQAAAANPAEAPCTGGQDGAGLSCTPPDKGGQDAAPTIEGGAKGLAAGCAVKDKVKGSCVECTGTHDLAAQFCSDAKIDVANCSFKDTQFACMAGGKKLEGDLAKKTGMQKLYDNMGLIVTVAKLALGQNEKEPEKTKVLVGVLDVLDKYKKEIFTLQNLSPAVDEVAAIAKASMPEKLDDAKIQAMKDQINKTVASLQKRAQDGQITNQDVVALASGWMAAVPKEALGGTDVGDLLTILQNFSGNEADLAKILESLGGGDKATLTDSKNNSHVPAGEASWR